MPDRTTIARLTGSIALASMLAACGGGGGGTASVAPAAPATSAASAQSVKVTFTITVPKSGAAHTRMAQYISAGTTTASIKVNGGAAQTGACTSGTCSVTIDAPIGLDTFDVQLLDGSSNVLSYGTASQTISGTIANTVTVAFGGVPKTVIVSAATTHLVPGTQSSTSAISVVVKDASSNTIIGSDAYVSATGAAAPITVTDSDSSATSLSPTSLTSPASASSTLTYTGNGSLAGATLSISATGTSITPTPATVSIYAHHTILEYSGFTSAPNKLTAGPDGNLWFTESQDRVGKITPSGTVSEYVVPTSGTLGGIAAGSDGALWFTEFANTKIGRVTTAGSITEYSSGLTAGSSPYVITTGTNNDLYFGEFGAGASGRIGRITTGGVITESAVASGSPQIDGVLIGSDGRLWFAEAFLGNMSIGVATIPGLSLSSYSINSASNLRTLANGSDNAIWFTDQNLSSVGKIQTDGTGYTEYAPPTAGSNPSGMTAGIDGHLYFVEISGNNVVQLTVAGVMTEYAIPTAYSQPLYGASGPDGNYWFNESSGNKIGRFIL